MCNLISIIVPVYNVEDYLHECIDSILNQSYRDLEIILVDDGSPDNSPKICDEYAKKDSRIKVIHKKNGGLSSARNAGLDLATGTFIGFIDSDDWIEPDMYKNLISAIKENNCQLACCGRNRVIKNQYKKQFCLNKPLVMTGEEGLENILLNQNMDTSACDKLFYKNIWCDYKFPLNETNEDAAVIPFIVANAVNIIHIGKIGYNYRLRKNSITTKFQPSYMATINHSLDILHFVETKYPHLQNAAELYYQRNVKGLLSIIQLSDKKENQMYYIKVKKIFNEQFKDFIIRPEISMKERLSAILMKINIYKFIRRIL